MSTYVYALKKKKFDSPNKKKSDNAVLTLFISDPLAREFFDMNYRR